MSKFRISIFLTLICICISVRANSAFDIWEFRIKGMTLIDPIKVETLIYPFLGAGKTFEDIQQAAIAIERLYKEEGYPTIFVDIPEQEIVDGVVNLVVTEGRISRVTISGSDYFSIANIKDLVPSVKKGETPLLNDMKEELINLNSLSSDLSITPILKPGNTLGTLEVQLNVDDELPLHGDIGVNNYASDSTTELRLSSSLRYDNLWQKFHSVALQAQLTPEDLDEIQVFASTYVMPVNHKRDRFVVYAVLSDSKIITNLGNLTVLGKGSFNGIRYLKPLISTPSFSRSLSLGFDYKDFSEDIRFSTDENDSSGGGIARGISYSLATLTLSQSRKTAKHSDSFSIGAVTGLPLATNDENEFEQKTLGASPNFVYLEGDLTRVDFITNSTEIKTKFKFQLTNDTLISNEQMGIGGAKSVRGYPESLLFGDKGYTLSFEGHWKPHLSKDWKGPKGFAWDLYGLLDYGAAEVLKPAPEQPATSELYGYGLGMFIRYRDNFSLKFECAIAGTDFANTKAGDAKVHASLDYNF